MLAPMPFEAPVTTAVFPLNLPMGSPFSFRQLDNCLTNGTVRRKFRTTNSDGGKAGEVGLKDVAPEAQAGELSFPSDPDQARGFELFDMVGERGGADGMGLVERLAGHRIRRRSDLLEDPDPAGLRQGAGDPRDLLLRQADFIHHYSHNARRVAACPPGPRNGTWA